MKKKRNGNTTKYGHTASLHVYKNQLGRIPLLSDEGGQRRAENAIRLWPSLACHTFD